MKLSLSFGSALALAAVLLLLALGTRVALAENVGASCLNAEVNSAKQQDTPCDIDSPYCIYKLGGTTKACAKCPVMQTLSPEGGSCNCDARTEYCSQASDSSSGLCRPYTLLNSVCATDDNCKTTTDRILPSGASVTLTNERLFCVNGKCKPCSPTAWTANVGQVGVATVVCDGYDSALSSKLGRYATLTRLPAIEYTCSSDGDIVYVQPVVDYDDGYSCADRTQWPKDCSVPNPNPSPSPKPSKNAGPDVRAELALIGVLILVAAVLSL